MLPLDPMDPRTLPVGVFDSGVGGLTVLTAVARRLPGESLLYLGDTARLPYGTKSPGTVARYAVQAAGLLVGRGVKLLVVACNTASAHALGALGQAFPTLPVVGVIEPGAAAACAASPSGRIAVIATEGTVAGRAYERAIAARRPEAQVVSRACGLFVGLAEEGWAAGPIAEAVAHRYLGPIFEAAPPARPDCLVLGCTHFPLLVAAIRAVVGPEVAIVDSASTTAEAVAQRLACGGLAAAPGSIATVQLLATDAPDRFARVAASFLPTPVSPDRIELVDLGVAGPAGQARDEASAVMHGDRIGAGHDAR
jgi:glutamate racemase